MRPRTLGGALALSLAAAGLLLAFQAPSQDIFQAIRKGDVELIKAVLQKDGRAMEARQGGVSPLLLAVRLGNKAVAELLVGMGADINSFGTEVTGFSPFEWTAVTEAIRTGNLDLIRVFVEKGADLKRVTSHGESYLHFAAIMNRKDVAAFLIDHGIDVDIRKAGDLTPLHVAAALGFDDLVSLLVARGARLDSRATDGATPLHLADAAGQAKTAALLRSRGAKDLPRSFPRYAGTYLGAKRPGLTPEPFVPELFRDIYRVHSSPAFSPDGREVYWECIFMGGNNDASRVWFMKEEGGRWTPPRVAPFSTHPSGGPAFFADGKSLVFFSVQPRGGSSAPARDPDLWIVDREAGGWGGARHLDTPLNRDGSAEVYPVVARDRSIYVVQRLQGGTEGVLKSAFVDGKYGAVETIGDLFGPSAVDAGRSLERLLFSSPRRRGSFDYELYVSFLGPEGRWSTPAYLGESLHPGRRSALATVTWDGRYLFIDRYFSYEWVDARVLEPFRQSSRK